MNKNLQNGFILGAALQGKTEATSSFPITITFMNGNEEWAKVGVDGEGKIAEPTIPPIPEGYVYFKGWFDGENQIVFPYTPQTNKSLSAEFGVAPEGAILYAPLKSNTKVAETGQTITYNDNNISFVQESGIVCSRFELSAENGIQVLNATTDSANWTASVWLKCDLTEFLKNTGIRNFDLFGNSSGGIYQYSGYVGGFAYWNNLSNREYTFKGLNDYKWHNYTLTSSSVGTLSLYIDGTLLYSNNMTTGQLTGNVGAYGTIATRTTYGYITSVRLYDRTLTQEEITLLASEFTPTDR